MNFSKLFRNGWPYMLLAVGSVIFLWPFIWMTMASMKLDREMFAANRRFLPLSPSAPDHSPYLDDRLIGGVKNIPQAEMEAKIKAAAPATWPVGIDPVAASGMLARSVWQQMPANMKDLEITPRMVQLGRDEVSRQLIFGQLIARSTNIREEVLIDTSSVTTRWQISGPAKAAFQENPWNPEQGPVLAYDFKSGDSYQVSTTVDLPFPTTDLQRLQLFLKPDDSWHAMQCEIEMNGHHYLAERKSTLFDTNWFAITYQEPGPEDLTNKTKTWLLLREVPGSTSQVGQGQKVRMTLTFQRRTLLEAWYAKITRNYINITDSVPFGRYVATSIFLVVLQVVCTMFSSSLVAYSFARLRWPGRSACLLIMLASLMIPSQVTMIPQFLIMKQLGWYDTLYPLWVPALGANAFFVFLLFQFMKGIPIDLEDAARLDGCGIFRIFWSVILPLLRPSLAAIGIFTFMGAWNDFMGPLIYISDQRLYPLSLGLYALSAQNQTSGASAMGLMMAGSLLMTLPVVVIFLFAQRYFIQGVSLTGMKG